MCCKNTRKHTFYLHIHSEWPVLVYPLLMTKQVSQEHTVVNHTAYYMTCYHYKMIITVAGSGVYCGGRTARNLVQCSQKFISRC